jgi:molybdopterin-guanine dinucleotide biosynthesis protein A
MLDLDPADVSLAVIAGGMGRRMGGPKAWMRLKDQSILAWLHAKLRWPGPTLVVSSPASANPPDADLFDQTLVDPVDGLGPLRGILTALEHAETPIIVATPIDMPFVESRQLIWIAQQLAAQPQCHGLMSTRIENGKEQIEPFPSAFRRTAIQRISQRLTEGSRSLHGLCELAGFLTIPAPGDWPERTWTNLNDPQEFTAFVEHASDV